MKNDILSRIFAHMGRGYMDAATEGGSGGGDTANTGAAAAEADAAATDDKAKAGDGEGGDAAEGSETILGGGTGDADDNADGGDGKSDGEAEEDDPVPEADYEFEFPDGVEPDQELLGSVNPIFKELGLGQKAAAKLVDAYVGAFQKSVAAQMEAHTAAVKGWTDAAKTDKEFGGEGYKANVKIANAALSELGTPELTKLLVDTGLSNHPEMIRFFYRAGVSLGDDTTARGDAAAEAEVPPEQRWYGKTTPQHKA